MAVGSYYIRGFLQGVLQQGYKPESILSDGITNAHSLRTGISWVLMGMLPATILLSLTTYFIAHDQASLQARAIKYGENIKDASFMLSYGNHLKN